MLFKPILAVAALLLGPAEALWPVPKKLSTGKEVLWIDQSVKVTYNGEPVRWTPPSSSFHREYDAKTSMFNQIPFGQGYTATPGAKFNSKDVIQGGVSRTFQHIFEQNFVPWRLNPRESDFEPSSRGKKKFVKSIKIEQTKKDHPKNFKPLDNTVDESYTLTLSANGEATIKSRSYIGSLRGLETFSQLFYQHSSGNTYYTKQAPVSIEDSPEFPHRGVLLDVSRNWFEIEDIKRTIDAMSWNKLNRLHIHITDSQSWPIEIPALPRLAEKGAYRKGLTYSPADIAGIYEYGIQRGVHVIMEIDMPGHIGVVDLAYKDLIVAYNAQPYHWWCAQPPCGAFRLNSSKVYDFLDDLFDDLLPRIAPYTSYFHTGGDELNANDSMLDPDVRSNDTAVLQPLLQKFIDFVHGKVSKAGLTPLVWEEMYTDWNISLSKDTVVQSWLGGGAVKEIAEAGHKVIDSNYNFWYLDCGRGAWLNFENGAAYRQFWPFNDWCGPTKSWRLVYSHDPRAGLSKEAAKRVLGGEVAVWSESIDPQSLDTIIWPRASAAGEVLWSGRYDASGQNRSQYEASPRIEEMRERMVARGVRAAALTQLFCVQNSPEECAFVPT
ncbi:beta-N-acetylhexosaminidase [Paramyrothecium foliicola]|nr:beta-N-acetylhexosaminidase [Paramyrothecium foliicola]